MIGLSPIVKKLWPTARQDLQRIVKYAAAGRDTRKFLNALYGVLSLCQKGKIHEDFSKLFRNGDCRVDEGSWWIKFAGRSIIVPLGKDSFWLDWDAALSLLGHDADIKQTYLALIGSDVRPDLFLDIGANYGTHSLLFLALGIETWSFEPNESCHEYFKRLCSANAVQPRIEGVALGASAGCVDLWFPQRETWLGTTDVRTSVRLALSTELKTVRVKQRFLDEYINEIGDRRILMKIDTEGNELRVLKGSRRVLEKQRPLIIFESLSVEDRPDLFLLLERGNYHISELPLPPRKSAHLDLAGFIRSRSSNFGALPVLPPL